MFRRFATSVEPKLQPGFLALSKPQQVFKGTSFGAPIKGNASGEVVFTTSLVGYPESMTDPSYTGQILVFTQPLIGNYGVPSAKTDEWGLLKYFESERIHVKGIVVNDYALHYSHWRAVESLGHWCSRQGVFALTGIDTRALVQLLRDHGTCLGTFGLGSPTKLEFTNNPQNLVAQVSTTEPIIYNPNGKYKIALLDCGVKHNIIRLLVEQDASVHRLPWNHDITRDETKYDGLFISNGPGNPLYCQEAVANIKKLIDSKTRMPIFGICMGNQLLGMAAGYSTFKLKFGNRGHNQPVLDLSNGKCFITSQNHGYALDDSSAVDGWETLFRNANDYSNEGIRHTELPYYSVQFHPESKGGPRDTEFLFSDFISKVQDYKKSII